RAQAQGPRASGGDRCAALVAGASQLGGTQMRKILSVALVFLAASIASALAQTYPSRPITIMVPFPPGGLTDVVGRLIAEGMRTALGQTIIIENVGGATRRMQASVDGRL